ncbi:MAG: hypothetical protein OSA51_12895, partial [Octadecabacter sp.]|nr:hypothetical protein [Octadecabacter sp.]
LHILTALKCNTSLDTGFHLGYISRKSKTFAALSVQQVSDAFWDDGVSKVLSLLSVVNFGSVWRIFCS